MKTPAQILRYRELEQADLDSLTLATAELEEMLLNNTGDRATVTYLTRHLDPDNFAYLVADCIEAGWQCDWETHPAYYLLTVRPRDNAENRQIDSQPAVRIAG